MEANLEEEMTSYWPVCRP